MFISTVLFVGNGINHELIWYCGILEVSSGFSISPNIALREAGIERATESF